nr:unnamed protein product [Callosobruchus chinensis]
MAPDVELCKVCDNNFIVSAKAIVCDICESKFHTSCVSVKDSWLKIITECENLLWVCDDCRRFVQKNTESSKAETNILRKEIECLNREIGLTKKVVAELEYSNELQKTLLKTYENNDNAPKLLSRPGPSTFSEAVKKPVVDNSSVLLIKTGTMGNADSKNILHDITSSVNPANLKVCINSTKCIKNGVAIHCKDDKSMNVLKENLANKLGSKYSINQAKKFNPRMIIKDVDLEGLESSEDILNSILSIHNFPNLQPSDIKFVTKLKQLNGVDVIIEVTPAARKTMLQVGHVFIGWKRSPVSDHLRIVKCSKCCSYGHLVKDCKSTDSVCHKCAGNHLLKDCKSEISKCINCLNYNKTSKNNIPFDHASNYLSGCPVYQNYVHNLKSRIDYG